LTLKQFFLGLTSAIIVAAFVYNLNLKSPDLRYQLSSPIDVDASDPRKVVQQIEIANTGNAVAHKVQIKIRKAVGTMALTKDSESDNYQQFKLPPGGTELDYDSLRPAGRIKISLSGGDPLTEQDLEIRHQDGLAKSALTSESSVWRVVLVVIFFVPFALLLLSSVRQMQQDFFRNKCLYHAIEALETRKPKLLSRTYWSQCLVEEAGPHAADWQLQETGDVSSWGIHRLLNSLKPKHLPDDIWAKVLPCLIGGFISRLTAVAQRSDKWSDPKAIRQLLALPKPSSVFDEKWNEFKKDLSARYGTALVTHTMRWTASDMMGSIRFDDPREIFAAIQTDGFDQTERDKARGWLLGFYCTSLVNQIQRSTEPVETINSADLNPLSKGDADIMKAFAYQCQMKNVQDLSTPWAADEFLRATRPAFMSDRDYDRLTKLAKAVKKADEDGRHYSALIRQVTCLLDGIALDSSAPTEIVAEEWVKFKRMDGEIITTRGQNEKRQAELERQEAETTALKTRVLRQLEVINVFLNDPLVIDRIEDYEAVFAPGNLSNLKRLAQQLRDSGRTKG
jgi:hypothetical protein